jgi:TfoX/Sxy family transcriptional regulator of competence genes
LVVFMKFKKAPQELVDFLMKKMKDKNCDYKKMFGYPAFFVNSNMFAGLFADNLFLRLSESDMTEITKRYKDVTPLEPMPGRPMKEYVVLPKSLYLDKDAFEEWINKSIKYTSELLPKKAKKDNPSKSL